MYDYRENTPVTIYGDGIDDSPAYFRVCPKCGRYVKADDATRIPEYQGNEPNATEYGYCKQTVCNNGGAKMQKGEQE